MFARLMGPQTISPGELHQLLQSGSVTVVWLGADLPTESERGSRRV